MYQCFDHLFSKGMLGVERKHSTHAAEDGSEHSSTIASHVSSFLVCFTHAALVVSTNSTGLQQCYASTTFREMHAT